MIFVDTSAIYAWTDRGDPNHETAIQRLQAILNTGEELLTHNYVLLEALSLIHARLGLSTALKLAKDSAAFVVEWVDKDLHISGAREMEKSGKRHISLVDHVSFLVMRRRNLTTAFAFDADFKIQGFRLFQP
jgi:uncharacterized protein